MALAVGLAAACTMLQIFGVRPSLPPAGHGATLVGEATVLKGAGARAPLARPA